MYKQIAFADDDLISSELIIWSGLEDVWNWYDMDLIFDFTMDVAEQCYHIDIYREDWDADFPGRSGTWHTVETDNEAALKKEMRKKVAGLLWKNRRELRRKRLEIKQKIQEENELRRQEIRKGPDNYVHVCTLDIWDDLLPTEYEYYLEVDPLCTDVKGLWTRSYGTWVSREKLKGDPRELALKFWESMRDSDDETIAKAVPGDFLKNM